MTIEAAADPKTVAAGSRWAALTRHWPILLGLLVMAVPTLVRMGEQTWSTEAGAHGPIVLATGLWLLSYNQVKVVGGPRSWLLMIAPLVAAWALYVFGRAYDFLSLEAFALYVTFLVVFYRLTGWEQMRRNLFPLFYLGFVVPPPGWLIDELTAPLRTFVSYASVAILEPLGYPIARQGVSLSVAQYQLLVEDACAGMNSLVGLTAISLFYIYIMHRASWRYAMGLILLIIPTAILVNIIRVVALILITYYFGDGAAQGFLHVTTGMVLFALAIAIIFGLDMLMQRIFRPQGKESLA